MLNRIKVLAALTMLLGALAACGSSGSSGTATTTGSPTASSPSSTGGSTTTITITDFKFTPASLTVKAGTKVTFVNNGTVHNATSQGDSTISTGNLSAGQSFTVTFTKPGTYNYICTIHPFMKGTVTVT